MGEGEGGAWRETDDTEGVILRNEASADWKSRGGRHTPTRFQAAEASCGLRRRRTRPGLDMLAQSSVTWSGSGRDQQSSMLGYAAAGPLPDRGLELLAWPPSALVNIFPQSLYYDYNPAIKNDGHGMRSLHTNELKTTPLSLCVCVCVLI